jgi:hypothetical protein
MLHISTCSTILRAQFEEINQIRWQIGLVEVWGSSPPSLLVINLRYEDISFNVNVSWGDIFTLRCCDRIMELRQVWKGLRLPITLAITQYFFLDQLPRDIKISLDIAR